MKKKLKKILFFGISVIILNSLYILLPWGIMALVEVLRDGTSEFTFFGFSYLTSVVFIVQSILLFLYFFKKFRLKSLVVTFIITLFFHSVLAIIPFPECDSGWRWGDYKNCSCMGIKKGQLFRSECIGIIKSHYLKGKKVSFTEFQKYIAEEKKKAQDWEVESQKRLNY